MSRVLELFFWYESMTYGLIVIENYNSRIERDPRNPKR